MKFTAYSLALFICFCLSKPLFAAGFSKAEYVNVMNEKAVIIYGVNWGRQWGCAQLENAQLQRLIFSRLGKNTGDQDGEIIDLKTPSKLFVDDKSLNDVLIVTPGVYALTGFDIKIAKSQRNIAHIILDSSELLPDGKPLGGTFSVNAGEIVYIGDFGLDCLEQPIPWRYYIEKDDFDRFVAGFKKKYPFVGDKPVIYRLFQTDKFGR